MRGRYTTEEEREKIRMEYQNGAKIPNLAHRYKLSDKTIKRIVGIYDFDYSRTKKGETKSNIADAEKVVTEYINNRINYLNEQIIKLSDEKKKLREFCDYLIGTKETKEKEE